MTMKNIYGIGGDADEPRSGDVGRGLGAATKRNENCSFTRTGKNEKNKAVLVSV